MKNRLRCSKILITGGSSGIGKAIAARMLEAGAMVVILARNADKLKTTKAELCSENLFVLQGDISKTDEIKKYIMQASKLMGGLDGVVNNAAIGTSYLGRGYEPWDITPEEWDKSISIDLTGAFFIMREAVNHMLKNNVRGNILNISSNATCMDIIGAYGSAKLSVLKMTRAFGKRFGKDGIIINGIAPGATATPMIARYCKNENDPYERHAIGRFIKPYEIAELAHYLMSEMGEIICGHTVVADGGDTAATL